MSKPVHKYHVEAGRQILRDGKPFIAVQKNNATDPVVADEITHTICALLNQLVKRPGKMDELLLRLEQDMAFPIELRRTGRYRFSVQYGVELHSNLNWLEAQKQLSASIFHSLRCMGKVDHPQAS